MTNQEKTLLKANKGTVILTSVIILLPMLIGIIFWKKLPDPMATHFGRDNEPNGWSSKVFAVFGLPLFLMVVHLVAACVTSMDPKRQNINPKIYRLILWLVPVVSLIGCGSTYAYSLGVKTDMVLFGTLFLGFLFVILGNYMPKTRQNYTIGIRIPWTLADEENWNKTHRLAGWLWVAGGILMILGGLTGFLKSAWILAFLLIIALVPIVYSFLLALRKNK